MTETEDTSVCELPTSFTVREAAYARLQDQIAAAEEVIISYRRQYNELSFISCLPPELLAGIFKLIRVQYREFDIRWVRSVSHVCSRWRHIALECPSLWSEIPFNYPAWAQETLARSKMAPLNVDFGRSQGYYYTTQWQSRLAPIVKAAVLELSHIKNLCLSQGNLADADYKTIIELLDAPAPFLETAEITHANLPVNLFAGVSPHLAGLELLGCSFNLQLPIIANLRTLKLCHAPTHGKIPVDQLIFALSTMTQLETLHVIDSLDYRHGAIMNPPPQQVANLPQLTELSIECLLCDCIFLLDHMVFPSSTRVAASYQTDLVWMNNDISIVRSFAEKLGSRVLGPIRSVQLLKRSIRVWRWLQPSSISETTEPPNLEISLPICSNREPAAKCFIHSLDLTHLETLTLDCPLAVELLDTYFSELSHLTTVMAGGDAITFLLALRGPATGAGPAKPKFLALQTLILEGWNFDDEVLVQRRRNRTVFEVLESCLQGRKEAGATLRRLIIEQCLHVREDLYVDALCATVGEVDWDGESNFTEDEESEQESFGITDYDGYSYL